MMPFFFLFLLGSALVAQEPLLYKNYVTDVPQSIHILEVDPRSCTFFPARALDMGIGRESVSSLAKRHGAVAAINGGFFAIGKTYEGAPCGNLKIGGSWYGIGKHTRGAIGWNTGGTPLFDRLQVLATAEINGYKIPLDGINQPRKENQSVVFTSDFGFTTLTEPGGLEVIIQHGRVKGLSLLGSTPIPRDGWILSLSKEKKEEVPERIFSKYVKATFHTEITPQLGTSDWNEVEHLVGGAPLLLFEGKRITDFSPEKTRDSYLFLRHARTAVGWLPNGHLVFVVVDGKQPGYSIGMTMEELALFMENLGCTGALNLDGGGSSTLFYQSAPVNHPAGDNDEGEGEREERKVSDAILITLSEAPSCFAEGSNFSGTGMGTGTGT